MPAAKPDKHTFVMPAGVLMLRVPRRLLIRFIFDEAQRFQFLAG
jgi:hypothetical protein